MRIKRFFAATMRAAISQVREELGPDAVIVSSKRAAGGIEIIAAVDYDEELAQQTLAAHARSALVDSAIAAVAQQPPEPVAVPVGAARGAAPPRASLLEMLRDALRSKSLTAAASPEAGVATAVAPEPAPEPAPLGTQDLKLDAQPSDEEAILRQLELRLPGRAWNDLTRRQPARARVLHDLAALEIAPEIALKLCNEMPQPESTEDPARIPLALLALLVRRLPAVDDQLLEEGGVVAVVGRTGVGKTTTIAKLAASFAQRHGAHQVALVSTDGYRRHAREQLICYARFIGVTTHISTDTRGLGEVLDALGPRKLVLIDTAGRSRRDLRLTEQLTALEEHGERVRILLALAANTDLATLEDTVRMFARLKPCACVLTKVDAAQSLGAALSTVIRYQLPIAYVTDGQRIPENLHTGLSRSVWLVLRAAELHARSGRVPDELLLAQHFGAAVAHA